MDASEPSPVRRESKRAGRPTEVDPEAVAAIALALFHTHGFDNVSMDDIAEAAGISRRSLFRWFPAKAALVWGGTVQADQRMDDAIAELAGEAKDLSVAEIVRAAYLRSMEPLGATSDITRQRLLIIASNAQVFAWGAPLRARLGAHLEEHLAGLLGEPADSLVVQATAAAYGEVAYAGLVWWARHGGDRSPSDVVAEAFASVRP